MPGKILKRSPVLGNNDEIEKALAEASPHGRLPAREVEAAAAVPP